jgi:hypothetical protein
MMSRSETEFRREIKTEFRTEIKREIKTELKTEISIISDTDKESFAA